MRTKTLRVLGERERPAGAVAMRSFSLLELETSRASLARRAPTCCWRRSRGGRSTVCSHAISTIPSQKESQKERTRLKLYSGPSTSIDRLPGGGDEALIVEAPLTTLLFLLTDAAPEGILEFPPDGILPLLWFGDGPRGRDSGTEATLLAGVARGEAATSGRLPVEVEACELASLMERWSEGRMRGGGESSSKAGTGIREVEAEEDAEEAEAKGEGRNAATGEGGGNAATGVVEGPGLLDAISLGPNGRLRAAAGRYAIGEVVMFASPKTSTSSGASANASYIVEGRGWVCGARTATRSGDAEPNRG